MSRHLKCARRESFRCHAQDYPTRTPGWAKIKTRVTLDPVAWERFVALVEDSDAPLEGA